MSPIRFSKFTFTSIIVVLTVVYNEFLTFKYQSEKWPEFKRTESNKDELNLLIIADPQILSTISEPHYPFSLIAVWDAKRYISRCYNYVLLNTKPDAVVFLGDLINDGSIANDEQYTWLTQSFKSIFLIPPSVKCVLYVPGDNDIGGEGSDVVTQAKIDRFYAAFYNNYNACKFVQFYHMNIMDVTRGNLSLEILPFANSKTQASLSILFSHFQILPGHHLSVKEAVRQLQPSVLFSGHDHDSYKFIGKKSTAKADQFWVMRDQDKNYEVKLNDGDDLQEICVPTASYRMGRADFGFGYATIYRKDGLDQSYKMDYRVLWMPSRFEQLLKYLWISLICFLLYIPQLIAFLRKLSRNRFIFR